MIWKKYRYVVLSTAISLIAFLRNVIFMRTLGVDDLAQITLMQTIVMLVGFFQLGLLNGAYILMAEKNASQDRVIVNLIWKGIVFLVLFAIFILFVGYSVGLGLGVIDSRTLVFGVIAGVATLASTFLNNALVAYGSLDRSTSVGMFAVLSSLALGVMSQSHGLTMALVAIFAQPFIIAISVLALTSRLRPSLSLEGSGGVRKLFRLGTPAFLSMIFILLSYQLERWVIVLILGEEALGRFYLVIMYMSFFVLLPASILNLHFPRARRALHRGAFAEYSIHARCHLRDIMIFFLVAIPLTFWLLPWVLEVLLPQFAGEKVLVFLVFPAMVFFVLRDIATLVFFTVQRTTPMIVNTGLFFATYTACLALLSETQLLSLNTLILARTVASFVALIHALLARKKLLTAYFSAEKVLAV